MLSRVEKSVRRAFLTRSKNICPTQQNNFRLNHLFDAQFSSALTKRLCLVIKAGYKMKSFIGSHCSRSGICSTSVTRKRAGCAFSKGALATHQLQRRSFHGACQVLREAGPWPFDRRTSKHPQHSTPAFTRHRISTAWMDQMTQDPGWEVKWVETQIRTVRGYETMLRVYLEGLNKGILDV